MNETLEFCAYVGSYIGYIIGGEILFIASLISAKMGELNLYLVLFSVFLSAMTVDWFFFWIGRKQGQPYVDKRPKMKAKIPVRKVNSETRKNKINVNKAVTTEVKPVKIRTDFPETWLWSEEIIG